MIVQKAFLEATKQYGHRNSMRSVAGVGNFESMPVGGRLLVAEK